MIPQCLLQDAKTVSDKMLFVNWWLSLEAKAMTAVMQSLRQFYRAPTRSNELLQPPRQRHVPSHPQHPRSETSSAPAAEIAVLAEDSMAIPISLKN
jgi:hypothetical protein